MMNTVPQLFERSGIHPPSSLTRDTLHAMLQAAEPHIPNVPCRLIPTSFDANDDSLRALPRSLAWTWDSAESTLRYFGTRGVMMRLPLFWQLESPLFSACKKAGAFIYVNDAANMPLGAAAVRSANIDLVVTDATDAYAFANHLMQASTPLPRFLVIHALENGTSPLPEPLKKTDVAQEVHLFPGLPILTQCQRQIEAGTSTFHPAPGCSFANEDTRTTVTVDDDVFPLIRYVLPHALKPAACSCGKEAWQIH